MKLMTLAPTLAMTTLLSVANAAPLETFDQRISYIVGQNVARQMSGLEIPLDQAAFKLALEEALLKDKTKFSLSQEDMHSTIAEAKKRSADIRNKKLAIVGESNKKKGKEYMDENAKKEGVVVTESGLQYKKLKSGSGEKPKSTDKVTVHYKGSLIDGTVFDSSYTRGKPATFPVTGVIKGWIEALQLMNVGDKFQLTIPGHLAYGPRGKGKNIGPNQTLLFDVQLIEIVK